MKATLVVPIAVFLAFALFCICSTDALKCYVCQDCEESFSEMQNCSRNIDKCVKMTLASGEVDRKCAERNQCNGRGNGRSKRSIDELIDDCLPHHRIVRQLLGGADSGSSSGSKNKNKDKQKEEKKGVKEATEIHCCGEDGCNAAFDLSSSLLILVPAVFGVLYPVSFSSLFSTFFSFW